MRGLGKSMGSLWEVYDMFIIPTKGGDVTTAGTSHCRLAKCRSSAPAAAGRNGADVPLEYLAVMESEPIRH